MQATAFLLIGFTVHAVIMIVLYSRGASRAARAHRFARTVDLALDETNEPAVTRRLARRERAGAIGVIVAVWSVAAWLYVGTDLFERITYAPFLVVAAVFAGHATGNGVVAWRESTRPTASAGPRIARASTPTHADYVPGYERWSTWVLAGASALLAAAAALVDRTGLLDLGEVPAGLLVLCGVVPAAVVVVDELLAHRLVQQRQVATTSLELAWDDALRARTLRDLTTLSLFVGAAGPVVLSGVISDGLEGGWPANPAVGVTLAVLPIILVAGAVMTVVSLVSNPQRHFRQRLWPAPVPADQAAQAGQAAHR
ncbi:hypothetical protein [Actinotalea sp. K2]|uniref:hypothetical protein n=1 Tax=Actinotalea sp. K2 TaxID=2939438 RepID=UPI002016C8EB|nr:hypothetical protein [Actinotalea sp. K2]MCL3861416.1 hypothetical protein [Actinotalea sp. K2]